MESENINIKKIRKIAQQKNTRLKVITKTQEFKDFFEKTENMDSEEERIELFKEKFGGCRATYYRYRQNLLNNKEIHFNEYSRIDERFFKDSCYFCMSKIDLLVHHINFNHADDVDENRIVLCTSCHAKIHALANPKVRAYVFDIKLLIENEPVTT